MEAQAGGIAHLPNAGEEAGCPAELRGRRCELPFQETRGALVLVHVQRRVGVRGGLFPTIAGFGGVGTWRERTPDGRCSTVSKIQTQISAPGNSVPPRLFALWAAGYGKDFAGIRAGRALRTIDLHNQSDGFQRSQFDGCRQSGTGKLSPAVRGY